MINSAKEYATLIEQPCIPMTGINDDFVWVSDLDKSPFKDCASPLFSVILNMNKNGAHYSIDPDKFEVCCMYSSIGSVKPVHKRVKMLNLKVNFKFIKLHFY